MPFNPPKDLAARIKQIPKHTIALPLEAQVARHHYERTANDSWNLLLYFERNRKTAATSRAPFERHARRLRSMVLLSLVGAFERFLKESAAACIDQVWYLIVDDRLDVFGLKGSVVATHFASGTVGRSLCESSTWLDCDEITARFRRILSDPFDPKRGTFYVFPTATQGPPALRGLRETVQVIWQMRHSIVHNAAVLTQSDAVKFRLLSGQAVEAPRILWPTRGDVWYVKLHLDEAVAKINDAVGSRLADLLSTLHHAHPQSFNLTTRAQQVADLFQIPITLAGVTRSPS